MGKTYIGNQQEANICEKTMERTKILSQSSNHGNQRHNANHRFQIFNQKEGKKSSTVENNENIDSNNIKLVKKELSQCKEKLEQAELESEKLKQDKFSLRKSAQVTLIDCQKKYKEEIDGLKSTLAKKDGEFHLALAKAQRELSDIQSSDCSLQEMVLDLKNQNILTNKKLFDAQELLKEKSEECGVRYLTLEEDIEDLKIKVRFRDTKIIHLVDEISKKEKETLSEIRSLTAAKNSYSQLIEKLNNRIEALNREVQSKEVKHKIEKQKLKTENSYILCAVQAENQGLQKKAQQLQLQVDTMNKDLNEKFKAQMIKKEQEFEGAKDILIRSKDGELKRARVQLEVFKKATKEKEQAEKIKFNNLKSEAESNGQLNERLNSQIKTLTSELNSKDKQYMETRDSEKAMAEKAFTDLSRKSIAEKRKSNKEISVLNIKCQKIEKELEASGKKYDKLKDENEAQIKQAKTLDGVHSETTKALQTLVDSKSKDLKAVQLQLEESEEAYQTKTFLAIVELKNKNVEINNKAENARKLNDEYKAQIEILKQEVNTKDAVVQTLGKKVISLQNIAKLEEEKNNNTMNQSTTERESIKMIEDLKERLAEAEGTIDDLKIKLSFKDDKLLQKDEDTAQRLEYHEFQSSILINIKKENYPNNDEAMIMPSAKDPANQNDNLELRERINDLYDLNKSCQAIIKEKEDKVCKLKDEIYELKSTENQKQDDTLKTRSSSKITSSLDVSGESLVKDKSPVKRSSEDIHDQVNGEAKKKRKLK